MNRYSDTAKRVLLILGILFSAVSLASATAPTSVCNATSSGTNAVTTISCTGNVTNGSALIAFVQVTGIDNASVILGVSDGSDVFSFVGPSIQSSNVSGPNGSTLRIGAANYCDFSDDVCVVPFFVSSTTLSTGSHTFTASWNMVSGFRATYAAIDVVQWTGQQVADIWDGVGFNSVSNGASPISSGPASGQAQNTSDLLLGMCFVNNGVPSAASGFTALTTDDNGNVIYYNTPTAGNSSGSCTYTGGRQNAWNLALTLRSAGTYSGITRRQGAVASMDNLGNCTFYLTNTAAGSLIVANIQINGNPQTYTVTAPNFGSVAASNIAGGANINCFGSFGAVCRFDYFPNVAAGISTWSYHISPTDNGSCALAEYSGIATSNPLDQSGTLGVSASSPFSGSNVSTTQPNELAIGIAVTNTSSGSLTPAPSGSWSAAAPPLLGIGGAALIADQILTSTQTLGMSGTWSGGGTGYVAYDTATFKAGSGGIPTFTISGTISPSSLGSGAVLTLTSGGTTISTATADASGNYTFANLANGSYTVIPSKSGVTFNPASQSVTLNGSNITGVNFVVPTWTISGTISGGAGTSVTLSGAASATVLADTNGLYTFTNLLNGNYTVTPSKSGFTFTPPSQNVTINGSSDTTVNFTANAVPTWTISGVISGGAGATVALSGASTGTVTADSNGLYTFNSLVNGSYTVTPSKSGFTFTPPSQNVTINGASDTTVDFTANAIPTWTISGTISPASLGSNVSVTLGGYANATTTTDSSGNYSFANLANGSYTITPSKAGAVFTPPSQSVTISSADIAGINFVAQTGLSLDSKISVDGTSAASTIKTGSFSTTQTNELLLAFISTDYVGGTNTTVTSVSGAGLTWNLVVRTNVQDGSSEIWRAFAPTALNSVSVTATLSQSVVSSMTVLTFSGADTSGTNGSGAIGATGSGNAKTGAPSATLVTTRAGSWVFGVGNDYDNAIGRTVGTAQTLVHQYLTRLGDTYWVQGQTATTPVVGTSVTINDTAPTTDRYNLSIVEVLPSVAGTTSFYSISGTVSSSGSGAQVTLESGGSTIGTTTADASGNYSFANLSNGTYSVTPSKAGFSFSPATQTVTINGANGTANFTATSSTWMISGNVSPSSIGSGTLLTLSLNGTTVSTATGDGSGNYSFGNIANGTYVLTPSKTGFLFTPANQTVTVNGANVTANFAGSASWTISGTITPSTGGANATVSLAGPVSAVTTSNGSGNYSFSGLGDGTYTVTPSNAGYSFSPSNQTVPIAGANASNVNFTAQPLMSSALTLDVDVSKDENTASKAVTSPSFSTAAPNELLLAFVAGDYLSGTNTTVTSVTGGGLTWVLVVRENAQSGTSEVWRAFAPSVLTNATVTANLSQTVVSSLTVMTFSGVNSSGTNGSGAIGAVSVGNSLSGAPTASLITTGNGSMVLGVGNDWDNAIARTPASGQVLAHQDLSSTGDTYWVQMLSNPVNLTGTTVSVSDTLPTKDRYNLAIVEVLSGGGGGGTPPPPPVITMTAPAPNGSVSGKATVAANASDENSFITGVQFLLDGINLGSQVTNSPYSTLWDTTTATAGTHTLTAIAYNSVGASTTSAPITVTVDNSGNPAIVGSWSSVYSLPTVAVNLMLLKTNKVLLYDDGSSPTVWDYNSNTFTSVPTAANLFCSGAAALADGRILMVGGYGGSGTKLGIANAEIFDPSNNSWTTVPSMTYARWYPTATTLSDGRVIVTAGWQTSNHTNAGIPEIYDPSTNSWTDLTNANNPFETYPFIYMLTDGRLVHVNGSEYPTVTDILNLTTQSWSVVDPNITDGGSASMYLPDKIMKAGSATDSQGSGPSSNTTFVLDMTQPSPAWRQTPPMVYPRSFLNLTTLPDGTVLATGGETDKNGGNIANAVYAAELWSPATETWSTMASMHTPREYHSTAILLPDARVLVSGMGADFGNVPDEMNAEFYSPPYLFKGTRPTITQAPSQISYGQNFFVETPDATTITSAVLIRTGAVTHFFDQNVRFVPVSFQQTSGGLTVTAPPNGTSAPPGYYMLFIVNSNGVPSVAPFVQLQ